jgi:uncharacterized protein YcsI (UPF0317 family)
LLPTNANEIGMLPLSSTRDYNVRTNLRLSQTSGVGRYEHGRLFSMLWKNHLQRVYLLLCEARNMKCPFCNSDASGKTAEEIVGELMKRVEANDAASIFMLAIQYHHGRTGL